MGSVFAFDGGLAMSPNEFFKKTFSQLHDIADFVRRHQGTVGGGRPPMPDFPKLQSVFLRSRRPDGRYVVRDEVDPDFSWVFEPGVRAVDKLDGTNMSVFVRNGEVVALNNRANWIPLLAVSRKGKTQAFLRGLLTALERGWLESLGDGQHFGGRKAQAAATARGGSRVLPPRRPDGQAAPRHVPLVQRRPPCSPRYS